MSGRIRHHHRRRGRALGGLLSLTLLAGAPVAFGHGGSTGTFDDIAEAVFEGQGCNVSGCHGGSANAGGLNLEEGSAWAELVGFGFGQQPNNGAAQTAGKMRVDPGRPWNSYLIDKLRGHLVQGEGLPMPRRNSQWDPLDECVIREIENWILRGAPREGWVEGDEQHSFDERGCNVDLDQSCVIDECVRSQPALDETLVPDGGVQLEVASPESEPFTGHSGSFEQTVTAKNTEGFITKIEVYARAGTAYLTLAREGDDLPLMVALGDPGTTETQVDTLELPEGTGIPVGADQSFVVRQVVQPDAFDPLNPGARAEAWIRLEVSNDPSLAEVQPFADELGTQALFTPARGNGATGGLWPAPSGASVVALRLWADDRALRGVVQGTSGTVYELDGTGETPYAVPPEPVEVMPGTGLAYLCQHDNTHVFGPKRQGCGEVTTMQAGFGIPPPGLPAVAGEPAPWCASTDDCAATEQCVPANLTGGDAIDDGRCTLVGLQLAQ